MRKESSLYSRFQWINVEGERKIENYHWADTIVITIADKIHWYMLDLVGGKLEKYTFHSFKVSLK